MDGNWDGKAELMCCILFILILAQSTSHFTDVIFWSGKNLYSFVYFLSYVVCSLSDSVKTKPIWNLSESGIDNVNVFKY